jgi:hypothetical protein
VVIGSARMVLTLPWILTKNIWVSTGAHIINDWLISMPFACAMTGSDQDNECPLLAGKGPMAGDGAGGTIDATSGRILYRRWSDENG